MLILHATRDCGQTPRIVFAFEEIGAPWRLVWRDGGYFLENFGGPGPLLEDGELRLSYSGPIIRHAARTVPGARLLPSDPGQLAMVEQWMDFYLIGFRVPIITLAQQRAQPADRKDAVLIQRETAGLHRVLATLERQLASREYIAGEFSAADVTYSALSMLPRLGVDLAAFPRTEQYLARIAARPAWARSQALLDAARAATASA